MRSTAAPANGKDAPGSGAAMTVTPIRQPILDAAALNEFLDRQFPEICEGGRGFTVEAVGPMTCRMRMTYHRVRQAKLARSGRWKTRSG